MLHANPILQQGCRMERWRGRVAVVTGASSGIGEAVARELVKHGMVVVGAARRKDHLDRLCEELNSRATGGRGGKMVAMKVDISRELEVVDLFKKVDDTLGGADVLVNNAGVTNFSGIEDGEVEQWKRIFDVNVMGSMMCAKKFLGSLRRRNLQEGHLIVINSVAGHQIRPNTPFYCASKHALRALSGCLRRTLAEQGSSVKVTDICPGATETEIFDSTTMAGIYQKISSMEPSDVAQAVTSAVATSPHTQICEVVMNPVPTSIVVY